MAPPSPKSRVGPAQVKTDRGWCTDQGALATGSIADRISAFNKLRGMEEDGMNDIRNYLDPFILESI